MPARRRPAHRAFAAFIAALLLFAWTGEAQGFSPCPHHGWRSGLVAASAPHHSAAGYSTHAAHAAESGQRQEHHPHSLCTCLGDCAAGATHAAAPPSPTLIAVAPVEAAAAVAESARTQVPPRLLAHLLPYALAPPTRG